MAGAYDESFLPQIVGLFYATFDPILGPTILHQVPENLISSSASDDGSGAGKDFRSGSQSRSRSRPRSGSVRTASPAPMTRSSNGVATTENDSTKSDSDRGRGRDRRPVTGAGEQERGERDREKEKELPVTLLDFGPISEYVIPKGPLHGKLVSFCARGAWAIGDDDSDTDSDEGYGYGYVGGLFNPPGGIEPRGRGRVRPSADGADEGDANSFADLPSSRGRGRGGRMMERAARKRAARNKHEYRIIGLPSVIQGEGGKYRRNQYIWNLCFVFRAKATVAAFEPVVRKVARILRSAELDSGYLSSPQPEHTPLPAVLEQLFEDLNSYSETSIPLDGFNWLELRLFPFYPNPPEVSDWDVPIALVDINALKDDNWDITAARVAQYINGINHSARIAQLADADPALVRETLRHMLFYQVIMMIDIFQYSNMYTCTPAITRLAYDESVMAECGPYVTRPRFPVLDWPALAALYTKMRPGTTVHQWSEAHNIVAKGIDPRRFISFGIIKGFMRRVHRWPIVIDRTAPLLLGQGLGVGIASNPHVTLTPGPSDANPSRRRVGFQSSGGTRESRGGDSAFSRHGDSGMSRLEASRISHAPEQSAFSRSLANADGRGDSQFTLRSGGSAASVGVLGTSPASLSEMRVLGRRGLLRTSSQSRERDRDRDRDRSRERGDERADMTGRSLTASMADTHPSVSSRRSRTLGSINVGGGAANQPSGGRSRDHASTLHSAGPHSVHGPACKSQYEKEDELLSYLDGNHHADEIQVRMGMSWSELEKVLGLDDAVGGVGRKGVAVVYR